LGFLYSNPLGKSSFIEKLGLYLANQGKKIAVLVSFVVWVWLKKQIVFVEPSKQTVDPSSSRTGGSILGDMTRMVDLSRHPNSFVRQAATWGTLGTAASLLGLASSASGVTHRADGRRDCEGDRRVDDSLRRRRI